MAREGQGYPCYQHDMMMMMMIYKEDKALKNTKDLICHKTPTRERNGKVFHYVPFLNLIKRGVMAKMLDCSLEVNEFELQWRCNYVHFQTNAPWERYELPSPPPSYGLNRILLFFYKDGFSIR